MAVFKCKMCGGNLEIGENQSIATCEYCGTEQTVSKSRDETVSNLFSRANNLRIKCEFDKAERVYEKILDIDNTDSEAHWGIVLCKYGIEYVEDPKTYKRIPTCHRTIYEAVLTDVDFLAAIENADEKQKVLYVSEARVIDKLQKNIINIVNNEEPFDVFICYKETDENGKRTIDSAITNDIYYQLTEEGFKVFYAPITLEDKLGHEYEPYIFAALNSAKVMLVVGTKPEYFDSVWVRNEWSRFLKTMKKDRSKLLVPCYRDMDVYELPDAFAHLQAQDMGKIGFINDLIRGLKKAFNRDVQQQSLSTKKQNGKKDRTREEKSFWEKLKNKFKVDYHLDFRFPKLTTSILGFTIVFYIYFLIKMGSIVTNISDMLIFSSMGLLFVSPLLILTRVVKRKPLAIFLQIISLACSIIYFSDFTYSIKEGVSSAILLMVLLCFIWTILVCLTKKVHNQKQKKKNGIATVISVVISIITVVVLEFSGFNFIDYQLANVIYNLGYYEYAHEYFVALGDYNDSEQKADECNAAIDEISYKNAIFLNEAGNYLEAYEIFVSLDGYKDSADLAQKCKLTELKNAERLDIVTLGDWVEGNTIYNGENSENWYVVDKNGDQVLLLSTQSFDFNGLDSRSIIGGWENSTLRTFLNNDFYELSFSDEIKSRIVPTKLQNSLDSSDTTTDKIFVLSKEEIEDYFPVTNNRDMYVSTTTLRNIEDDMYTLHYGGSFYTFKYANGEFDFSGDIEFDVLKRFLARDSFNNTFCLAMWIDVSEIDIEIENK